EAPTRKAHFVFWLQRVGTVVATLSVFIAAIYSANYAKFHSFAKSDLSSPPFEKVFKALLRIKPTASIRYVPVTTDALEMAFEVSPQFALLKPEFESRNARVWTTPVFEVLGIHQYGPWFTWALRNVMNNSGYYKDPITTNAFYRQAAREINKACDEGRVPSRLVLSSFLDPGAVSRIRYLPAAIPEIAKLFLFRHQKVMVRADTILKPWMSELYTEMVFRAPQPKIDESNAVVIPNTFSAQAAVAVQNFVGAFYVYLFVGLAWAALAAFVCLLVFWRRWRLSDPLITILLLLGTTIAVRFLFFSFLQATWWMSGYDRYLFPVMPLSSCFVCLLIYEAIQLWRKRGAN
ncbi:MAG TPA: hypothetical protein VE086_07785, partial [Chthoniobacterales bacterium]|nr:hypothetical protein [Chthoniobacterales bacterium]